MMLAKVRQLEAAMREMPGQLNPEEITAHHFCEGLYARELYLPAGTAAVGKQHAKQNFFVLLRGEMTLATPDGPLTVRAPYMAVTQPGDKRAVYAVTDCVCMNFHANPDDERDLLALEHRYIMPEALPAPQAKELTEWHG